MSVYPPPKGAGVALAALLAVAAISALIAAVAASAISGVPPRAYRETSSLERIKFDGHFYITFPGGGGLHDPDCPCAKPKTEKP